MKCLVCGRDLWVWNRPDSEQDYYCSAPHGPLGEGLFYREVWDGEKYVLTHTQPGPEVIAEWERLGQLVRTAPDAENSSSVAKQRLRSSLAVSTALPRGRRVRSSIRRAGMRSVSRRKR